MQIMKSIYICQKKVDFKKYAVVQNTVYIPPVRVPVLVQAKSTAFLLFILQECEKYIMRYNMVTSWKMAKGCR